MGFVIDLSLQCIHFCLVLLMWIDKAIKYVSLMSPCVCVCLRSLSCWQTLSDWSRHWMVCLSWHTQATLPIRDRRSTLTLSKRRSRTYSSSWLWVDMTHIQICVNSKLCKRAIFHYRQLAILCSRIHLAFLSIC